MQENNLIIGCVDGSTLGTEVSKCAAWVARTINRPLTLLNVVDHHTKGAKTDMTGNIGLGTRDDLLETLTQEEQAASRDLIAKGRVALDAAKNLAWEKGVEATTLQRHGELYENLTDLQKQMRVLILGLRGEESQNQRKVGRQIEDVIRSLNKPIWLVGEAFEPPKKVLLAYDGTSSSKMALQMVAQSPLFQTLACHVVNVNKSKESALQRLDEAKEVLENSGVETVYAPMVGEPVAALLSYQSANGMDMIAMGAFSHNRLRDALFGSFTAKVISRTTKPLLLLR